ncbi:3-carboxy-cis,cis-muconate cycloisomerase [Streptomyces aureoverticillatus]|uniref:3-carboxy-cis,cis-muconate cycloisomerase n=1 Tax=Streptomyces aureoverticillatus TaxID=66871 RepID=UPI0013D93674|nr:3-carboxy-cis,cis-muconate cycloisomerase [Streptomyces aureoverticillatus]QIB42522.1 3-carboxy-cis,cis-muconate cycloisomerase [Streptomyces aureoverticillatus]
MSGEAGESRECLALDVGLLAPGRAGSAAERTTSDRAFLQAMLDAEAALTRAQAVVGMAPAAAADAVTEAAADAARFDARDIAVRARGGGNPVIPLVADLTAAVPEEAAPYVHRGATSQDILDTATMLVTTRTLDVLLPDLARVERELARLARAHRDTAMPGRTLTQHAAPTTFGLKAAGWRSLVLDARDRVAGVRGALPAQWGGAVGTLAVVAAYGGVGAGGVGAPGTGPGPVPGLDLVAVYARELGLAEPTLPWHTLRTPVADLATALAFTAGALGKLAADVLTLSRTEIGELSEGTGGTSSAMPHKANPVRATLIAAAAHRAPALAATLLASLTAADERPAGAWHAEWEPLRDLLRLAGGAARDAAELCAGLQVHPEAMRANLDLTGGLIVSERLVVELTPALGRARAAALVASAARRARERDVSLADALTAELAAQPPSPGPPPHPNLTKAALTALTDPTHWTGHAGALTDRALRRH